MNDMLKEMIVDADLCIKLGNSEKYPFLNKMICQEKQTEEPKDPHEPGGFPHSGGTSPEQSSKPTEQTNEGKLLLDATCAPADIRYPTDLSLLNEAREKTEEIIDTVTSHSI